MISHPQFVSRALRATGYAAILAVLVMTQASHAASPGSGTVSEGTPLTSWTGPLMPATGSADCGSATNPRCDNFALTILPPSAAYGPYQVEVTLTPALLGDWDLQVYGPDGSLVDGSGNSPGQAETIILVNPPAGTYTVAAAPFAPLVGADGNSYTATAQLKKFESGSGEGGTEPLAFAIHQAPAGVGRNAAEPSCGANWNTDRLMFIAGLETLRVTFDDCTSPARATWKDVSFPTTSLTSLDPILFTDSRTGRTIASQLAGKTSLMAFSDDDGDTWTPSQGSGINSGVDHQTVGGGAFAAPLRRDPNGALYPHAVYYCSQDLALAQCARSDDGGLTFGPAVPIYTLLECGGLHGAVKVAPDGTVYVPNKNCGSGQGVVVSEDNGVSWAVRPVPGTSAGTWDPSVGIATDGTVYLGLGDGTGGPMAAVSSDKGVTWRNLRPLGDAFGIRHTSFPVAVAGDPDRASVAWLGSSEPIPGGSGDNPAWPGDWYLYVAHTYDGGATWTTVNATPGDPVQRGTICSGGFNGCPNGTRNLLDFMDSDVDREGRVVVAYADGCVGDCVKQRPNSFTEVASIARQVNGRRLFAAFDRLDVPAAPVVSATFDTCATGPTAVLVTWSRPEDHGSPISGYRIYRSTNGGAPTLLASVGADTTSYLDTTIDSSSAYTYSVTAVNGIGEGPSCGAVAPVCSDGGGEPEDACTVPGLTVLVDKPGDSLTGLPEHDVLRLSIAEPLEVGAGKITFVLKMASLAAPPPDTTWPVVFKGPDGIDYFVRMMTNAIGQVSFSTGVSANPSLLTASTPADPASGFSADGTIRIVVSRAAIGNPQPGQALTDFITRIRVEGGAIALTPDNMPDSVARTGSYTVVGNESCAGQPPVANDDAAETVENRPVRIDVVANDDDGGHPPLTVESVTQGANGSVTNNADGTVTYAPRNAFVGIDSFSYTVRNDRGLTDTAKVSVRVSPAPRPDLVVTGITASNNKAREGDKVTITAEITNHGNAQVIVNSQTEFLLDGTQVLGTVATPGLMPGETTSVSINWDTRGVKGDHTITVTADRGEAVDESNETNNSSTLQVSVRGNKVTNGSFEEGGGSSGPAGWSSEDGGGDTSWSAGGSDGSQSISASGNGGNALLSGAPVWTSDAIAVTAGETLDFVVSVKATDASSAATAGLVFLGEAGAVLDTVSLVSAPLTSSGFAVLQQSVTIPLGVTQVRVRLVGFAPTDTAMSGTVAFDGVGLFGR